MTPFRSTFAVPSAAMATLQSTIQSLAQNFATDLVAALRSMSLEEILGATGKAAASRTTTSTPKKRGRPAGSKDKGPKSALSVDAIIAELEKHKSGLRAEHLRKALGASKNTFNYHASKALQAKAVRKTGEKRATTYFVR